MKLKKHFTKIAAFTLVSLFSLSLSLNSMATVKGGRLVIYSQEEPKLLNPLFFNSDASKSVYNLIYSGLLKVDENFEYIPDMAVSVPTLQNKGVVINSEEGMVVTYKMKEFTLWHDGEHVTSEDVKFTWKCFTNPEIKKDMNEDVEGYSKIYKIETPDEKTVKLYFREVYPNYKNLFKYILPKHGFDPKLLLKINENHSFNKAPIGSGPFKFVDWKKGKGLILDSFDKFYNSKAHLDQILFLYGGLTSNIATDIEKGKIHVIQTKSNDDFKAIVPHLRSAYNISVPQVEQEEMAFNMLGNFGDLNLRKSLVYAINKDKIASRFNNLMPSWSDSHPNAPIFETSLKYTYNYDLKMSQYLLDSAGWVIDEKDGVRKKGNKELVINLVTTPSSVHTAVVDYLKETTDYLGIKLAVKTSYNLDQDLVNPDSYDIALYSKSANINGSDRVNYIGSKNVPPMGKNYARYFKPELDDVLYSSLSVNNLRMQRDITHTLAEDLPVLPLFTYTKNVAVSTRVGNFRPNPVEGNTWNTNDWWLY